MSKPLKENGQSGEVRHHTVTAEESGQRVDNFLLRVLPGVPRSHVYRLLRRGEVRVNGGRAKPDRRLDTGDMLRIPPVRIAARQPGSPPRRPRDALVKRIIYEDAHILAVNKPSGTAAHGGSGISFGVIELLRAARPDLKYLELVHRLDRDTSGCLLLAKRRSALRALHQQLREGAVEKDYLALVLGRWNRGREIVDAPLLTNLRRGGERFVCVDEAGKPAVSRFRPVELYDIASLLRVRIDTGRTHQIRVHAAWLGHPVAGDDRYGDREQNRRLRQLGLKRMFLHAQALSFRRPGSEEELCISAPLDPDLTGVLERLSQRSG